MRDDRRPRRLGCAAALIALLVLAGLALADPARAAPNASRPWCLPPVFDGGERLHGLPGPRVFWLELLLRQHEICRRDVPGEVRILLLGSSSVFGFPLTAEHTFAHRLNELFAAAGLPAHVFNLAFVNPYQVRDAVILHAARRYAPDIILYPVTLAEFMHAAPVPFVTLLRFFEANRDAVAELAAAGAPGLEEPLDSYLTFFQKSQRSAPLIPLRELGRFARTTAGLHARTLARAAGSEPPPLVRKRVKREKDYDCDKTRDNEQSRFASWQEWNVLAYLDALRREDGVEVVLVYWPVGHDPVDDCYSARFTAAKVAEFGDWLQAEARTRGMAYLDLHTLLPPEYFLDTLHASAEGHARLAEVLAAKLQPLIIERLRQCRATGVGCGLGEAGGAQN